MRSRSLFALVGLCALASTSLADRQSRAVGSFHTIDASSALQIDVRPGKAGLVIEADAATLPRIKSEVKNGVLRLWMEGKGSRRGPLKAHVQTPSLRALTLTGACSADVSPQSGDKFEIALSGACEAKVELKVRRLAATLDGASTLHAHGSAQSLGATASGACSLKTGDLKTKDATVNLNGASNGEVFAASSVGGEVSGASSLVVRGGGKVSVKKSGPSSVSSR